MYWSVPFTGLVVGTTGDCSSGNGVKCRPLVVHTFHFKAIINY